MAHFAVPVIEPEALQKSGSHSRNEQKKTLGGPERC